MALAFDFYLEPVDVAEKLGWQSDPHVTEFAEEMMAYFWENYPAMAAVFRDAVVSSHPPERAADDAS